MMTRRGRPYRTADPRRVEMEDRPIHRAVLTYAPKGTGKVPTIHGLHAGVGTGASESRSLRSIGIDRRESEGR